MIGSDIVPFASGMVPVSDRNRIYWEACGTKDGTPALYLHGGPGAGIGSGYRRHFDPERVLIVAFDQRGCGRSRPSVTDPDADLTGNHTHALIADIEALREHLRVDAWLVYGASWGTTLALAYAQAHPDRVSGLVLAAVTTTTTTEVSWITQDLRRIFPREWDRFAEAAQAAAGERLIDAYDRLLRHSDHSVRHGAARAWCMWEDVHVSLTSGQLPDPRFRDADFRLCFATMVVHYWKHAGFLGDEILPRMERVAHIPGVLIHGRWDVSSPLETAWRLHRAWPASDLVVIDGEGHGGPAMADAVTRAVARLERLARYTGSAAPREGPASTA